MIAITGASGQLGRLAIDALLRTTPAKDLVALVRTPAKAQDLAARGVAVRQADYADPAGWDAALQGVRRLLLVSSSEVGQRVAQHRTVIDAARRAGVELLAYTSVLHADTSALELAREHRDTEALLRASGVPHVLLRNGWYTENYLAGVGAALQHGVLAGSAGEGRIASAARADYAEAAAAVLQAPDQAGKVHELAGDSAYTLAELAAEISRAAGRTIPYRDLPEAEYARMLEGAGLPPAFAAILAQSDAAAAEGALFDGSGQLSRLIGRPTTPWQAQAADAVRAAAAG